ncbi:Glutaminase A [uncultured Paludibacter sp.]|uniref:Glutaminase A n=1 Tax=uncultured Paludibacter sp. TaxID=497635 RepID=A0A653AK72_9BACT|nr:Glutaminase A [uncultured Paludibacter sp.]
MRNARKTFSVILFTLSLTLFAGTKTTPGIDFYKSSFDIALRAPAVPLILSDPYLSIWSPYDKLTEGSTQHWTGESHPLIGAIRVDGKVYRFMGKDVPLLASIIPSSNTNNKSWTAAYTFDEPKANWIDINYDDTKWKIGEAAFGTSEMPHVKTLWNTKDIWIRRTFDLNEDLSKEQLILQYSHDDIFELYLNGEKLVKTDYSWKNDVQLILNDQAKNKLKKGKNVIAAHCHNTTGGAYVDFQLFKKVNRSGFDTEATQLSVDVLPTQTYYSFLCGPVELNLIFTAPFLPNDLDLISTPINYITYNVKSANKKFHEVQLYIETTPQIAVNDLSQRVSSERIEKNGITYLKTGTIDQPILKHPGDGVRIDWGYAFLSSGNGENQDLNIGDYYDMKQSFIETGKLLSNKPSGKIISKMNESMPALACVDNIGTINKDGKSGYVMLGYDDVYSIEYFFKQRMAYWKHDGKVDIYQAFERAKSNYSDLLNKCREFDNSMMNDALKAGGKEYSELCALAYRHTIAAHKLLKDEEGNLLFLSKENNSNGCINTVDLTYPSAPLFLIYNTELMKGMMNPIFYYSESGRWTKPFAAHDIGTYPVANGQVYGEDMPVEESGNMLILAAAISFMDGNTNYAQKHWETLTTWANYLVEKGLDPENQLCTDDFAGHLAHNANLSVKAILGIAGYGYMAKMAGKTKEGESYINQAKTMAQNWQKMARDEDHYKLAFDKSGTWSQKYNMVWDKLFHLGVFDPQILDTEISYYVKKQNTYGLPLDSRKEYTKSDWVMWTACMSPDEDSFNKIVNPIYKYADETTTRVPLSDWHDTETGKMVGFKARSVIGAYYMKMLFDKVNNLQSK